MSDVAVEKKKRRASDRFTLPRFMLTCGAWGYLMVAGTVADELRKDPLGTPEPWNTVLAIGAGALWPTIAARPFGLWIVGQLRPTTPEGR